MSEQDLREAQARISHLEYVMYTPGAVDHTAALARENNDLRDRVEPLEERVREAARRNTDLTGQVGRLELKIRKAARELER